MTIPDHIMARAAAVAEPINPGTVLYDLIRDAAAAAILAAVQEEREGCAVAVGNFLMLKTGLNVVDVVRAEEAIRNRSVTEGE